MEFHAGTVTQKGGATVVEVMCCTEESCALARIEVDADDVATYGTLGATPAAIAEKAMAIAFASAGDKVLKCKSVAELAALAKLQ
jgi:hypothetical protein